MSLQKKGEPKDTWEEGGHVTTRQRLDEAGRAVPGVLGEPGPATPRFWTSGCRLREISVVVSGRPALQSFAPVAPGLSG